MNAFRPWVELNLTAAARAGKLAAAFEVEETVQVVSELIDAGRCPVLTGESGIGKTAIVHELARRAAAGAGPARLVRRPLLQVSLQRRVTTLHNRHEIHGELNKLIDAIRKLRRPPALFIRDLDLVYHLDLEDRLAALAAVTDAPLLGEGSDGVISAMLEYDALLDQLCAPVRLEEPPLERVLRILRAWADHGDRTGAVRYGSDALEQALMLAHRFLPRSRLPHKALALLAQSATHAPTGGVVRAGAVIDRFCTAHRVPRVLVDPSLPLDLGRVQRVFERNVFGQAEAVRAVVDTIGVLKAGLSDPHRPLATLLLVGPTGVGKTYIAQLVAEVLFGRRDRVVRVNLADYPAPSDAERLFGDASAPRPADQRGVLTNRLAGYPFAVLLLDEFEKAHGVVHDRFLQLVDEGAFINAAGETVSCRALIVIATSNAGYEHNAASPFGFGQEPGSVSGTARRRLEMHFRFELLNRFDRIVHFAPLGPADVRNIVLAELRRLPARSGLRQRHLRLEVERPVVDWLIGRSYDAESGARHIRRVIEQHVTVALARVLAQHNLSAGARVRLVLRDDAVEGRVVEPHVPRDPATSALPDSGRDAAHALRPRPPRAGVLAHLWQRSGQPGVHRS